MTEYTVVIEPCAEGGYHTYVPAIQGCRAQGETVEEVTAEIAEIAKALIAIRIHRKGQQYGRDPDRYGRGRGHGQPSRAGTPAAR